MKYNNEFEIVSYVLFDTYNCIIRKFASHLENFSLICIEILRNMRTY